MPAKQPEDSAVPLVTGSGTTSSGTYNSSKKINVPFLITGLFDAFVQVHLSLYSLSIFSVNLPILSQAIFLVQPDSNHVRYARNPPSTRRLFGRPSPCSCFLSTLSTNWKQSIVSYIPKTVAELSSESHIQHERALAHITLLFEEANFYVKLWQKILDWCRHGFLAFILKAKLVGTICLWSFIYWFSIYFSLNVSPGYFFRLNFVW